VQKSSFPIRALIADDEPLARQRIEDLLAKEADIEIAGVADSGPAAVEAIRSLDPDLLFLDVQMPGMTGIEVMDAVGAEQMPVTIFTTAYDQYAVKAFELAALDYVMKPFDDERFAQALDRARESIAATAHSRAPKYLERIGVEARGQVRFVPVDRIEYITADGPYAELHVGERTLALRERMHTLEERLDPEMFFRIHRSAIVRLDRVDVLLRRAGGDYAVRLKDGTELSLSRARRDELERLLGGNGG
jgi:two-component system LytT family response regulator